MCVFVRASFVHPGDRAPRCVVAPALAAWKGWPVDHADYSSPVLCVSIPPVKENIARYVGFCFQLILWAKPSGASCAQSSVAIT